MRTRGNLVLVTSLVVVTGLAVTAFSWRGAQPAQATIAATPPMTYPEMGGALPEPSPEPVASFRTAAIAPQADTSPVAVSHEVIDGPQIEEDAAAVGMTSLGETAQVAN